MDIAPSVFGGRIKRRGFEYVSGGVIDECDDAPTTDFAVVTDLGTEYLCVLGADRVGDGEFLEIGISHPILVGVESFGEFGDKRVNHGCSIREKARVVNIFLIKRRLL